MSEEKKDDEIEKGVDYGAIWCGQDKSSAPYVLQSPMRYVQGAGIINHFGRYLQAIGSKNPLILISAKRQKAFQANLDQTFKENNITATYLEFGGETSFEEVNQHYNSLKDKKGNADAVVSIGGGKNIDAGKLLSYKLNVRFVSFPTIASNDSPCSALCIMYHTDHSYRCGVNILCNPDLVIVDTEIIAKAPSRFFSAGIGDAMATYYEAKTCYDNPKGRNMLNTNITETALALAELCATNLYKYGVAAVQAVEKKTVSREMEKVCESTILLSGVGFESGGLAAAHAIAQGLSAAKHIESNYMHGEMVAVGLIAHLLMEKNVDEAIKCARFLMAVKLPVCLQDLKFDVEEHKQEWEKVLDTIMSDAQWFRDNMNCKVTRELVISCLMKGNKLKQAVSIIADIEKD